MTKTENFKSINPPKLTNLRRIDTYSTRSFDSSNRKSSIANNHEKRNEDTDSQKNFQKISLFTPEINIEAEEYMAAWCFDILISALKKKEQSPALPKKLQSLYDANIKCSIFVTWLKDTEQNHKSNKLNLESRKDLRGCIGCLNPIPVLEIKEYAILSGLKDFRFPPITLNELAFLTCKFSILNKFEKCKHIYDWEIGKHGIIINFSSQSGRHYSSTFLPEIALEHSFTHKSTIEKLIQKTNYRGTINDTLLNSLHVTRYCSSIATLSYDNYKKNFAAYN